MRWYRSPLLFIWSASHSFVIFNHRLSHNHLTLAVMNYALKKCTNIINWWAERRWQPGRLVTTYVPLFGMDFYTRLNFDGTAWNVYHWYKLTSSLLGRSAAIISHHVSQTWIINDFGWGTVLRKNDNTGLGWHCYLLPERCDAPRERSRNTHTHTHTHTHTEYRFWIEHHLHIFQNTWSSLHVL